MLANENPYVANAVRDEEVVRLKEIFDYWRNRMAGDAQYAAVLYKKSKFRQFFKLVPSGHWSWQTTSEQRKRFMESGDPMRDYPDEMFEWISDGILGFTMNKIDLKNQFWIIWKALYG